MTTRVALVTGGARGIGLGITKRLLAEGWNVAAAGRRPEADAAPALAELQANGGRVVYVRGDMSDSAARRGVVADTLAAFGRIDALVNNAGAGSPHRLDLLEATEEDFDFVIETNLKGPYFLAQQVANVMVSQRAADASFRGSIVNITSISATVASVNRGDYCVSKAGLSMATKVFAARLAEFGIDCFEIRPGIIRTDMTAGVTDKYDALIAAGLTLERRWGTPDDVAAAVAALIRGDIPYATGQILVIDGGLTIDVL